MKQDVSSIKLSSLGRTTRRTSSSSTAEENVKKLICNLTNYEFEICSFLTPQHEEHEKNDPNENKTENENLLFLDKDDDEGRSNKKDEDDSFDDDVLVHDTIQIYTSLNELQAMQGTVPSSPENVSIILKEDVRLVEFPSSSSRQSNNDNDSKSAGISRGCYYLQSGQTSTHKFHFHNDISNNKNKNNHDDEVLKKYLASISVCIVYKGQLQEDGDVYTPGRIHASLHYTPDDNDGNHDDTHDNYGDDGCRGEMNSIGSMPSNLQTLNSREALGRYVIQYQHHHDDDDEQEEEKEDTSHDDNNDDDNQQQLHQDEEHTRIKPIQSGTFEIRIQTPPPQQQDKDESTTLTTTTSPAVVVEYSISITGRNAYPIKTYLWEELYNIYTNKERIYNQQTYVTNCNLDIRVGKQKINLLEQWIQDVMLKVEQCKMRLEECEDDLELEYSDDLYHELKQREEEFTKACQLQNVREQNKQTTIQKIQQLQTKEQHYTNIIKELTLFHEGKIKDFMIIIDSMFGREEMQHVDKLFHLPIVLQEEERMSKSWWRTSDEGEGEGGLGQLISLEQQILHEKYDLNDEQHNNNNNDNNNNNYTEKKKERYRLLLKEHDQTSSSSSNNKSNMIQKKRKLISSSILHSTIQLFPKDVLLQGIEQEMNQLLSDEIRQEELVHPILLLGSNLDSLVQDDVGGLLQQQQDDDDYDVRPMDDDTLDYYLDDDDTVEVVEEEDTSIQEQQIDNTTSTTSSPSPKRNRKSSTNTPAPAPAPAPAPPDLNTLIQRRDLLSNEVITIRKKKKGTILTSNLMRGQSSSEGQKVQMRRDDLLIELLNEIDEIDNVIKLDKVYNELCTVVKKKEEEERYITIHALHGYECLMDTSEAIMALDEEVNRLVGRVVSKEVLDDLIEGMHGEGYFGEESDFLLMHHPTNITIKNSTNNNISTADRVAKITKESKQKVQQQQLDQYNTKWNMTLDETEKSIRMGLFCITFLYFRSMDKIRRQKAKYSGEDDLIGGRMRTTGRKARGVVGAANGGKRRISSEREKLIQEEENYRLRKLQYDEIEEKVRIGMERKRLRQEHERFVKLQRATEKSRKKIQQQVSSTNIQRIYRGYLHRKAVRRWRQKSAHIAAVKALCNGSSIAISRVFRGYVARRCALQLRKDISNYILTIRSNEAKEEEDEYWRNHKFQQWKKEQQTKQKGEEEK